MHRCLVMLACAAGLAACNTKPSSSAAATPAVTSAAPSSPAPACDATNASFFEHEITRGWKVVGHLDVVVRAGKATLQAARDASGKPVPIASGEATVGSQEFQELLAKGVCVLSGAVVAPAPGGATTGPVVFDVLVPDAEDEHADLSRICVAPPDFHTGAYTPDASQFNAIGDFAYAHDHLAWLTTRQWRAWVWNTESGMASRTRRSESHAYARARGAELATAARSKGFAKCWYADVLGAFD